MHEQTWHRDGGHSHEQYLPDQRFALRNLSLVLYLDDVDQTSHTFSVLPESVEATLAVGETVILLPPPPPFSRRFNSDGEGTSAK